MQILEDRAATAGPPAGSVRDGRRGLRLIGRVLLAYVVARAVTTGLLLWTAAHADPLSRIGAHASLLDVATAWDGQWYRLVAVAGYPTRLPVFEGAVARNAWAFLPAYPRLVALLTAGHPGAWPVAAVAVSVASGAVASVLLAVLLKPHAGERGALTAALLFMASPVSFVLQIAYAEALFLALLLGVLVLVDRRRYLWAVPLVLALAFTRPGLQAVALAIGLVVTARFVRGLRAGRPRVAEAARGAVLTAVAGAAGFLWPWIASRATGRADAYLLSELAWRKAWSGSDFAPGVGWFYGADFWFGTAFGPFVLAAVVAGGLLLLLSPPARRLGATGRAWCGAYALYLLLVFFPQSSVFRLLMPMAPIGGVLARAPRGLVALVLLGSLVLQAVWIRCVYGAPSQFWAVP